MKRVIDENDAFTDKTARNVYYTPFIPGVIGLGASAIPHWSPLYGSIWGGIMLLLILRGVIGYFQQKHRDYSWHALTGVITYDVTGLFCLIPFWRVLGEQLWLLIVLLCLYVLCIFLTHHFRYIIIEGVFSARKTRFGKIYWTGSFLLVALTGGGSYGFSHTLQMAEGLNNELLIMSACLVPFGFIIVIGLHCLWVRVENPYYDLNSEKNPN